MRVFISWSKQRSRAVALALRKWIPKVIQEVEVFMSDKDIEAGRRWSDEIARELETSKFGLSVVTAENRSEPWLLFESGALAKNVSTSKVIPYLLFGVRPDHLVGNPLHGFQARSADKEGTRAVMASINNECDRPLAESDLDEAFERWWPDLEGKLAAAERESGQPTPPPPSEKDILAELLAMGRVQSEQLTIAAAMLTKLAARPQPAVLTVRKGSAEGASTPGIPANYAIAAQLYEYAIPADGQLAVPHLTGVTGATGPSGSDPKGR